MTERRYKQELNTYYEEVIGMVHEAESLLIFGPGEAKGEFRKRLEKVKPANRTVAVETTDNLTDRQNAAKVREYFKRGHPAVFL